MFRSACRKSQMLASASSSRMTLKQAYTLPRIQSCSRLSFSTSSLRSTAETEKSGASESSSLDTATQALEAQIKERDAKIRELQEQILYSKADYQNLQRRSQEEKAQAGDYAITRLAKDLTNSIDILGFALRSVPEEFQTAPKDLDVKDPKRVIADLYSGVDLTSKSVLDMLKSHGITQFDPTGEKFDPKEHEALYQAPIPGKEPGTVLECSKVGYRIKDRLLRAAEVGVVQATN